MDLGSSPQVRRNFRRRQFDAQEEAWRAGADDAARSVEGALSRLEESPL